MHVLGLTVHREQLLSTIQLLVKRKADKLVNKQCARPSILLDYSDNTINTILIFIYLLIFLNCYHEYCHTAISLMATFKSCLYRVSLPLSKYLQSHESDSWNEKWKNDKMKIHPSWVWLNIQFFKLFCIIIQICCVLTCSVFMFVSLLWHTPPSWNYRVLWDDRLLLLHSCIMRQDGQGASWLAC